MNCVIVGARDRVLDKDREEVENLIRKLSHQFRGRLQVVSVGCDRGIGKYVRDFCLKNEIIFVECRMKLEGKESEDIPRSFFVHTFLARNKVLLELGDEFYVFKGNADGGIVEAVIPQAIEKVGEQRVRVYEFETVT